MEPMGKPLKPKFQSILTPKTKNTLNLPNMDTWERQTLTLSDGTKYVAQWKNDERHGEAKSSAREQACLSHHSSEFLFCIIITITIIIIIIAKVVCNQY